MPGPERRGPSGDRPREIPLDEQRRAGELFRTGINALFDRHFDDIETDNYGNATTEYLRLFQTSEPGYYFALSREREFGTQEFTGLTFSLHHPRDPQHPRRKHTEEYVLADGVVTRKETDLFRPKESGVTETDINRLAKELFEERIRGGIAGFPSQQVSSTEVERLLAMAEKAELSPVTLEQLQDDHTRRYGSDETILPDEAATAMRIFSEAINEYITVHATNVEVAIDQGIQETVYITSAEETDAVAIGRLTQEDGSVKHFMSGNQDTGEEGISLSFIADRQHLVSVCALFEGENETNRTQTTLGIRDTKRVTRFIKHPLVER